MSQQKRLEAFEKMSQKYTDKFNGLTYLSFDYEAFSKARFSVPVSKILTKPIFNIGGELLFTTSEFFFFYWNRIKHAAKVACDIMGETSLFNKIESVLLKRAPSRFYVSGQKPEEFCDDLNEVLDYVFNFVPSFANSQGKTIKLFSNSRFIIPVYSGEAYSCLVQYLPIKHQLVFEQIPEEVKKHFIFSQVDINNLAMYFGEGRKPNSIEPEYRLLVENGQTGFTSLGFHATLNFSSGFTYRLNGKNRVRHIDGDKVDGVMQDIADVFKEKDALAFWENCFGYMPMNDIAKLFHDIAFEEITKATSDKLAEKITSLRQDFHLTFVALDHDYLSGKISQKGFVNQLFHHTLMNRNKVGYKTITDKIFKKLLDEIYKERK